MKKYFNKGIALFLSVLMVMSCFSIAFPMVSFAENGTLDFGNTIPDDYENLTSPDFTVTSATDKVGKVEQIYDDLSGVEYTAVYGGFAGDISSGMEENYTDEDRAKVYNNLIYSPIVAENTDENHCAALWNDVTLYKAGNYIRYYYPTTVMVYDGKTAPRTAISMGVKAAVADYITPYGGYIANASDGIVLGNRFWKGIASWENVESPLFLQPYFDYTESKLTADGSVDADERYRHEGGSAYFWTNNLTFNGSFAADEYYKAIRPQFCWTGGNNYEEGLTTLTSESANKCIYVINIVPFERVLEEARYIGSAIMLKPDDFTAEYVERFVELASAIIAAKPTNFISADMAEADVPEQVEAYAKAVQNAISAWDSWQRENSVSISNSHYYIRMKYDVVDSWDNAEGEYKLFFDYKPFNGKGPTETYCVNLAESWCSYEGTKWISENSNHGILIPGFPVAVRAYAKPNFLRSYEWINGVLQVSADGQNWTDLITNMSFTAKSSNILFNNRAVEETVGTTDISLYPEVADFRSSSVEAIALNKLGGEASSATVRIDQLKDQYGAIWTAGYSAEDFTHKISVDKSGNTYGVDSNCISLTGNYDNLTITAVPDLQCKNSGSAESIYYCYTRFDETGASAVTMLKFKHPMYNIAFNYYDDGSKAKSYQVSRYYTNSISLPNIVATEYVDNGLRYYIEGWDNGEKKDLLENFAVTGDIALNAVYSQGEPAKYSIEFYDFDGKLIGDGNKNYDHGNTVIPPEAGVDFPDKRTDGNKEYNFAGWYPKFSETATGDVKYQAVYTIYDNDYSYVSGKSVMDELVCEDMTDRKCNYISQKLDEFLLHYNAAAALNKDSDVYIALYPDGIYEYTEYVNYLKGAMACEIYKNLSEIKSAYDGVGIRYYNFEHIIDNFENQGMNVAQLKSVLDSKPVYDPGDKFPEYEEIASLYESCCNYYEEALSFKAGLASLEADCGENEGDIFEYLFRDAISEYNEYGWESSLGNINFDMFLEILTDDDGTLDVEAVKEFLEVAVSDLDRLLDSELFASFINSITVKDGDTVGALGVWNYDYVYKNSDNTTVRVHTGDKCKTVREFIISKVVDCLWGGSIQTKLFRVLNESLGQSIYNFAGSYFDIAITNKDGWQWLPEILHLGLPTMPHDYVENWFNPLTGDKNVQFGDISDYKVDHYKYFTGDAFGHAGNPEYDYTDFLQILDKAPIDKKTGTGREARSYWKPFTYGDISNEDRNEYKPGDVISERQALDAGLWEGTTPIYYQNSYGDKTDELAPSYEPVYFDSNKAWHINDWNDFFRTFAVATSGLHVPLAEMLTCKAAFDGSDSTLYGETDIVALDAIIESTALGEAFYDKFFIPVYGMLGITQEYDAVNNPGGYRNKDDILAAAGTFAVENNMGVNCSSIYNSGETLAGYLLQPIVYWLENELFVKPAETILELIPNLVAELEYNKLISKIEDTIINISMIIKPIGISIKIDMANINVEEIIMSLIEGFGFSKDVLNGGLESILTSLVSATRTTVAPTEQDLENGKYLMKVKNQSVVDKFGNVFTKKQVSKTEAAVWVDSEGNSYYLKDIGILTQWLYKLFWKDDADTADDESLSNSFLDYFDWDVNGKNFIPYSIPVNFIMAAGLKETSSVQGIVRNIRNYYIEADKGTLLFEIIRYLCDVQIFENSEKIINSLLSERENYGFSAVLAMEAESLMKVVHLVNENVFRYDGNGLTVKFYDSQGKVFNVQIVPVGEAAEIPAFVPGKQPDDTYHYTFNGFDKSVGSVFSNMDVNATYTKAEHIFDNGVVLSDATCTQDGKKIYSCSLESCDYYRSETIRKFSHKLVKVEAVDAGCTRNGNIEHYRCEICKKLFSDETATEELTEKQTIIPAKGHNLVDGVCQSCGAGSIVGSGVCNGDIRWAFDLEKCTLIISGVGNMKNFYSSRLAPWDIYKDQITHIIVEEGITGIGNLAFYRLAKVIDVSLPSTLLTVGSHAFNGCAELPGITIPASVNKIGTKAFHACSKLSAFTVSEGNMNYTVSDGVLFSKDMTTLVKYPDYREADSYVIPETVVKLGEYSFSGCQYLTEIDGLGNVSVIETGAFSESFELTQVKLYDTVTKISPYAFYGCTGLESVSFADSVKEIGDWAFYGCNGLVEVNFDGSEETWASYGLDQANESLLNATVIFADEAVEQMNTQPETANLLMFALRRTSEPPVTECTHTLGEMQILVAPGCEVSGTGQRKCEFCDYFEIEEIPQTGHADENTDGICDNCNFDFTENCKCTCHLDGIVSILWKIINFFKKILGISHFCPCGVVR